MLSASRPARIIYFRVGDDIVVMDLMHKANLVDSGRRKAVKASANGTKTAARQLLRRRSSSGRARDE